MRIPEQVSFLLSCLHAAGYAAYAVGGCVRDTLLGRTPNDWDLCTSALPEEMRSAFRGLHLIETGLKHGTLTVMLDHQPYEVTTFRIDGEYTDHRHPDSVSFVNRVDEDLARRDFTVNAMAYSPEEGIIDLFGGQKDLEGRIIRCVGNPYARFEEDALRILRALRFASVYGFEIEPETAAAVRELYPTLSRVAPERIRVELSRLICGMAAGSILRAYPEVFAHLIPALKPMIGYDQHNHHHKYDLWEHTIRAMENIRPTETLRFTMLLHDTGKPEVALPGADGETHFKNHQARSAELAEEALNALRFDNATRERILTLVRWHDIPLIPDSDGPESLRRLFLRRLNHFGEEIFRELLEIHRADRLATGISTLEKEDRHLLNRQAFLDSLLTERPCFSLKDLAVTGRDITALGFSGPAVGEILHSLLEAVMNGRVSNERDQLLAFVTKI